MEPTSEPENRQSRGLARFWPVHGMSAPAQRQSDEDPDASRPAAGTAAAHASDQPAGAAGPTGEHPQVSDQQSQPQDDQQGSDDQSPFAPARPHPALTSDTQMVALGSRRPADALLGSNGARWTNQGGFPPVETNGHRNGDAGPRHGGAPIANGQAPVGPTALPGPRAPYGPGEPSFGGAGEESARPPFLPAPDEARQAFLPSGTDVPPGPRPPFVPAENDTPPGSRSPFAPAENDTPPGPLYAPSPFGAQAAGSTSVANAPTEPQEAPPAPEQQQPMVRPVSATPAAAGSAQVPVPAVGRPVSAPPAAPHPAAEQQTRVVPQPPAADPSVPTRLEPSGWATAGPRPGASGSASVPVSAPVPAGAPGPAGASAPVSPSGGRRSRAEEAADEPAAPAPRRSTSLNDTRQAPAGNEPLRPGDVHDISITFWQEASSEQFRAEWHEVKAQFVDDPVAALTRAHDLLTEAVHELTESMLAERDELDPLRGSAKPDTESMRMAMRGYREFLDRILAL